LAGVLLLRGRLQRSIQQSGVPYHAASHGMRCYRYAILFQVKKISRILKFSKEENGKINIGPERIEAFIIGNEKF